MLAGKIILALYAALLAALPVCADQAGSANSNASVSSEAPRSGMRGQEGNPAEGPYSVTRSGSHEVDTPNPALDGAEKKTARSNLASPSGLHWTIDGDRPSLAYRFSETGVVRLRGNIRGARVVVNWNY